jgi:hypothetical protein
MARFLWLVLIAVLATPALAQDDGDGGLFDVNSVFGNDPFSGQPAPPKVDPVVVIRNSLARAGAAPLEKKQESPLKKVYEKELKAAAKTFERRYGADLETAISAQAAQSASRGGGRRGGGGRATTALATEVRRISDQLMDKAIASLRIDQQAALRRFQSEQLRVTRLNAMTQSMTLAGLSLTPEQKTQMEALYTRESRLRTLIIVEAKGASHQARVAHLEAETNDRVEQLLDENQRMALAQVMAGSNSR